MRLTRAVILTTGIRRLAEFYEGLLQMAPTWYRDDYAEFATTGSTLALFTVAGHDAHIAPGVAEAGTNRSMKIEFEVDDIDATAARLQADAQEFDWVLHPPKDLPWGTRSVMLRDADGHLVELYEERLEG